MTPVLSRRSPLGDRADVLMFSAGMEEAEFTVVLEARALQLGVGAGVDAGASTNLDSFAGAGSAFNEGANSGEVGSGIGSGVTDASVTVT